MSSHIENGNDFSKEVMSELTGISEEMADTLMAEFFHGVAEKLPEEGGHAHEAFRNAGDSIARQLPKSRRLRQSLGRFSSKSSGDPEATRRGIGTASKFNQSITAEVHIDLPFVYKLEYGLTIRVGDLSGNKGPKIPGTPEGSLYGPRQSGTGGLLQWREGGAVKRARTRKPPAAGFFRNAIQRVTKKAKGN